MFTRIIIPATEHGRPGVTLRVLRRCRHESPTFAESEPFVPGHPLTLGFLPGCPPSQLGGPGRIPFRWHPFSARRRRAGIMTRSDVCPCAPTAPEHKGACQLGHVSLPGSRPPGYAAASRPDPVTARKLRRPGGTSLRRRRQKNFS